MRKDPGETGCQRVAGDTAALFAHGIPGTDLCADEAFQLVKLHVVQPQVVLLIQTANRLFHIGNVGQLRHRRLHDLKVVSSGRNIVGGHVDIDLQQRLVVLLQGCQQFTQRSDMLLQLHGLGIHSGRTDLTTQFLQGSVDSANGLVAVHGFAFDNALCGRHGHDAGQPGIVHHGRIAHNTHIVRNDVVDFHRSLSDVHSIGHRPLCIVLRRDFIHFALVEVQLVGILQKNGQLLGVQPLCLHLTGPQRIQCAEYLVFQLPFIAVKEHQIIEGFNHLILIAQIAQLVDSVVQHFHTGFQLQLSDQPIFIGGTQLVQLAVLLLQISIVPNRPFNFYNVGRKLRVQASQHATQTAFNAVSAAMGTEKPELHRIDLKDSTIVLSSVFNQVVLNTGKGNNLLDVVALGVFFLIGSHFFHGFLTFLRSSLENRVFFFLRSLFALEDTVLLFAPRFLLLFLRFQFLFAFLFGRGSSFPLSRNFLRLAALQNRILLFLRSVRIVQNLVLGLAHFFLNLTRFLLGFHASLFLPLGFPLG